MILETNQGIYLQGKKYLQKKKKKWNMTNNSLKKKEIDQKN